ncbi:MAG: hypothetical protein SPL08_02435 [Pseudomonadota bacterium]|nr:hypothetical protein [Pseudomonadota bacterium]
MNPNAETILISPVVAIQNVQMTQRLFQADFYLKQCQAFQGIITDSGYSFTPLPRHNHLSEVQQIVWHRRQKGFGSRLPTLRVDVTLSPICSETDKKNYENLLAPRAIDEGKSVLLPAYDCIPLLKTAQQLEYHWGVFTRLSRGQIQAEQNLQDAIALRRQTYDLRQYGY